MCRVWQTERCGLNRAQRGPSILYRTKSRMPEGEKLSSSEATPELLSRSWGPFGVIFDPHRERPHLQRMSPAT